MITAQLNYFDMAVLGIMALSCLFALFRGFVKEILSLVAWVGSAFITIRYFGPLSETLAPHFSSPRVSATAAGATLYIGSLIAFAIFNRFIIKILKSGSGMGMFDNMLGFVFGGIRGAFIVSLGYLMIALVVNADNRPEWLEKAVTRPYAEQGAVLLAKMAPKYTSEFSEIQKRAKQNMEETAKNSADSYIKSQMKKQLDTIQVDGTNQQGAPIEFKDTPTQENNSQMFDNLLKNLNNKPKEE